MVQALPILGDRDATRIVQWLLENGLLGAMTNARLEINRLWAPILKSTALVRWLAARGLLDTKAAGMLLTGAIHGGRTDVALALLDVMDAPLAADTATEFLLAASFCGLHAVAEKLIVQGHCRAYESRFVVGPTASGCTSLVQWEAVSMHEPIKVTGKSVGAICFDAAVHSGNVAALRWLLSKHRVAPNPFFLAFNAADATTLLVVCEWMRSWLHAHSPAGCTHEAMDKAAANGHLHVVQWLHTHRTEGRSARAITAAAENGHLAVVEWLYYNRSEIDPKQAMLHAAARGHLDVVLWLAHARPDLVCTGCVRTHVFDGKGFGVAKGQSIDVLRWVDALPERVCASCRPDVERLSTVVNVAALQAELDVVKYIHEQHREKVYFGDPMDMARRVAEAGHLGILQWIHSTFGTVPVRPEDAQEAADWRDDWTEVIEAATEFGQDHVIEWVRSVQGAEAPRGV